MTDNGHTDHEQLGRRLHEQGQAQAPPGLADDVMRQVRAEPRQPQRTWLRPVALCAAVAVLLAASVAGVARIGAGQSSSASRSAETHSATGAVPKNSLGQASGAGGQTPNAITQERRVAGVPTDKLATLSPLPFCAAQAHGYALRVPAGRYAAVSRQLQAWAAAKPAGAPAYDVQIRRAPASARLALTCP